MAYALRSPAAHIDEALAYAEALLQGDRRPWGYQGIAQFFASCDNHYLRDSYQLLRHQLTALRHRSPISNAVSSHQVLVEAVEDDDLERASTLLRGHVLENEPRYLLACGNA